MGDNNAAISGLEYHVLLAMASGPQYGYAIKQAIKQQLREIVDQEDKSAPMSDDQLVEALSSRGVHIARRTVTKYRKALGLASSSRRKEF